MKVLIPNLPFYHFRNIAASLETVSAKVNLEVLAWNASQKSIIDVFDEVSPDVVFLHEDQLDGAFNVVCEEFDFNYVLVGSKECSSLAKKPSVIITSQNFEANFKDQENVISLPPAAKVAEIHAAKKTKSLESEVLIITGIIPHTPPVVDSIRSLCQVYKTKIIGDMPIELPNYLGRVSIFERADFIKSSRVFVDFGSYDYLDAAYLKAAPLFGQPATPGLSAVKTFSNIPTLMSQVDSLLSDTKHSKQYTQDMYEDVIHNHTYYHRCAQIFKAIGMTKVSDGLLDFFKELLK